jgi:hypothetical protein
LGVCVTFESSKKNFINQAGFSLTEVMIGGAVLAGVALAASQLFKDQRFAQRSITDDQRLSVVHGEIANTMMKPSNCNATLKNFYPSPSAIAGMSLNSLFKCWVNPSPLPGGCDDDNSTIGSDAYTTGTFHGVAYELYRPTTYVSVGDKLGTGKAWMIESMNILGFTTKSGPVTLRIKYKNSFFSSKSVSKDIVLLARFYDGKFRECLSPQVSSVDNFNNDLCKTFNFSESSGDGVIAKWDEVTQTCQFNGAKDCASTPGMHADGIGSDGAVTCKSIVSPVDAINLQNASIATCAPGQKPRVIFDPVSKRIGAQCI